jgi:hypothetical protein
MIKSQSAENYSKQKAKLLDKLEPCDLRNGESFSQAEDIIDKIIKSYHSKSLNNDNPEEFIRKAFLNFLRQDSVILEEFVNLSKLYQVPSLNN